MIARMIGRLFNTLNYQVNRRMRAWRKANDEIKSNRWSLIKGVLIRVGEHPVLWPFSVFVLTLILPLIEPLYHCTFNIFCDLIARLPCHLMAITACFDNPSLDSIFNMSSKKEILPALENRFTTIWGIQAAVAAMVYPIVIGFVSLLLQRRHSAESILHIYFRDSYATLAGISSIFLVFSMAVQYAFIFNPSMSLVIVKLIIYFDLLWLTMNVWITMWFLYRTVDFLRTKEREKIIREYAINYILPNEICRNLQYGLFSNAVENGYILGPEWDQENQGNFPKVGISPYYSEIGDIQVANEKRHGHLITNVRFRLLCWIITRWKNRIDKSNGSQSSSGGHYHIDNQPLFLLPSFPGGIYNKKVGLCRIQGNHELNSWEKCIVHLSFSFSKKIPKTEETVISVFADLMTEAITFIEAGGESAFDEAVEQVMDFHASILKAGVSSIESENSINYAQISSPYGGLGRSTNELFISEYRRLIEPAVQKLIVNQMYFRKLAYLSYRIIGNIDGSCSVETKIPLLRLSGFLNYRLR